MVCNTLRCTSWSLPSHLILELSSVTTISSAALDHWAALVVEGEKCSVLAIDGKTGSVLPDKTFTNAGDGFPGVWIKDVFDGKLHTRLLEGSPFIFCS
jgi:hypothetical protein